MGGKRKDEERNVGRERTEREGGGKREVGGREGEMKEETRGNGNVIMSLRNWYNTMHHFQEATTSTTSTYMYCTCIKLLSKLVNLTHY